MWYVGLFAAVKYECVAEIVSPAAIISIQNIVRMRSSKTLGASDIAWSHFAWARPAPRHALECSARIHAAEGGGIDLDQWCFDHFQSRSVMDVIYQLRDKTEASEFEIEIAWV